MPLPFRKARCHPNWGGKVSSQEAYRRAGGRRHWQRIRQVRALERKIQVLKLAMFYGYPRKGVQARIAQELGVSQTTICVDLKQMFGDGGMNRLREKYGKSKDKER